MCPAHQYDAIANLDFNPYLSANRFLFLVLTLV